MLRCRNGVIVEKASVEGVERVLRGAVEAENSVPGVVAIATDREGNFYEGAAGERELGGGQEMTTDTVFAIFSCTKAITGAAVMQLVEEGQIELSHPAKEYAPEISEVQVLGALHPTPAVGGYPNREALEEKRAPVPRRRT